MQFKQFYLGCLSHASYYIGSSGEAEIVYGQRGKTQFPTHKVNEGDELTVGNVKLTFLETPGHTPEGITIIADDIDSPDALQNMFTGDVGRPDLIGSTGFTGIQMGEMHYDSLHNEILPLPNETEIYAVHGAGNLCGKSFSTVRKTIQT